MRIYLFRHTEAIPHRAAADGDRWLTPAGRKAVRKAVKQLRRLDVRWDAILTSPLVRAVQTAELAAARIKGKAQIAVADALRPGRGSWEAYRAVAQAAGTDTIALVGHEPDLGIALGQALGTGPFALDKGAVVALELDKTGKIKPIGLLAPGAEDWAPLASQPPAPRPAPKAKPAGKPATKTIAKTVAKPANAKPRAKAASNGKAPASPRPAVAAAAGASKNGKKPAAARPSRSRPAGK